MKNARDMGVTPGLPLDNLRSFELLHSARARGGGAFSRPELPPPSFLKVIVVVYSYSNDIKVVAASARQKMLGRLVNEWRYECKRFFCVRRLFLVVVVVVYNLVGNNVEWCIAHNNIIMMMMMM